MCNYLQVLFPPPFRNLRPNARHRPVAQPSMDRQVRTGQRAHFQPGHVARHALWSRLLGNIAAAGFPPEGLHRLWCQHAALDDTSRAGNLGPVRTCRHNTGIANNVSLGLGNSLGTQNWVNNAFWQMIKEIKIKNVFKFSSISFINKIISINKTIPNEKLLQRSHTIKILTYCQYIDNGSCNTFIE